MTTKNLPDEFDVIVEISSNSSPVKYEINKKSREIVVDRFIQVSMSYPYNYGFIPNTMSGDGDPIDVLILTNYPILTGALIKCRPIGVLIMEDESGVDEKIIAVPISKIDPSFEKINDLDDVEENIKSRIKHFFEHYKDLERNKWTKIIGWGDVKNAKELINRSN